MCAISRGAAGVARVLQGTPPACAIGTSPVLGNSILVRIVTDSLLRLSRAVFIVFGVVGVSFAAVQFYVSNYVGPELTDILSSLSCIGCMVLVLKFWKPRTIFRL